MTDQIQDQDVELDENEIEEAHDPKNAEAQSIASVSSAEDKGPKAKARKGDKSNSEKMPKCSVHQNGWHEKRRTSRCANTINGRRC
jgi:hypothetical protein